MTTTTTQLVFTLYHPIHVHTTATFRVVDNEDKEYFNHSPFHVSNNGGGLLVEVQMFDDSIPSPTKRYYREVVTFATARRFWRQFIANGMYEPTDATHDMEQEDFLEHLANWEAVRPLYYHSRISVLDDANTSKRHVFFKIAGQVYYRQEILHNDEVVNGSPEDSHQEWQSIYDARDANLSDSTPVDSSFGYWRFYEQALREDQHGLSYSDFLKWWKTQTAGGRSEHLAPEMYQTMKIETALEIARHLINS